MRFLALPTTMGTGRVVNISLSGAFMETGIKIRLPSLVYLEPMKRTAKDQERQRVAAIAVRQTSTGIGLEWCNPPVAKPRKHAACGTASDAGALIQCSRYYLEFLD